MQIIHLRHTLHEAELCEQWVPRGFVQLSSIHADIFSAILCLKMLTLTVQLGPRAYAKTNRHRTSTDTFQ